MEIYCETDIPTEQAGAQASPRIQKPHGDGERPQSRRQPPRKGSQAPVGLMMFTLKASSDFQRLSRLGKKSVFPSFIMLTLKQEDGSAPFRLGLTVSRKVGNAVVRNRARRRLREMARTSGMVERLAGYDIVLIGRSSASERDFFLMKQDFLEGLKKAGIAV
jgi:ribonuclease P protein component